MAQHQLPTQCLDTQTPRRWGCVHARQSRPHVACRASRAGQSPWKQQLADVAGVKYKPQQQQQQQQGLDHVEKGSDAEQTSLEDIFGDEWADDDDDEGVVEDREVYNMDTGWSLTDLELDDAELEDSDGQEWSSSKDDGSESGMATHHIMKSIPAHVLKALESQQTLVNTTNAETQANKKKKKVGSHASMGSMRIITGSAAGKRLLSPPGETTRPMMEKVRGAVFSMLGSMGGTQPMLPGGTRWLDLYAGTGAVGLEALSRGCNESHFVEMDPAVTRNCLGKNIAACGLTSQSFVHSMKAEVYLQQARNGLQFAGGKVFDYISVCPPYEKASYEQLYDLLEGSPLVGKQTVVIVEYARRVSDAIRDTIGPLQKIRDKKYGRTLVAVYAAEDASSE